LAPALKRVGRVKERHWRRCPRWPFRRA
jgi:hypothetical protein